MSCPCAGSTETVVITSTAQIASSAVICRKIVEGDTGCLRTFSIAWVLGTGGWGLGAGAAVSVIGIGFVFHIFFFAQAARPSGSRLCGDAGGAAGRAGRGSNRARCGLARGLGK